MRTLRSAMLENLIKKEFPFLKDEDFTLLVTPAEQNMFIDKTEYLVIVKPEFYHKLAGLKHETPDYIVEVLKHR